MGDAIGLSQHSDDHIALVGSVDKFMKINRYVLFCDLIKAFVSKGWNKEASENVLVLIAG